VQPSDRLQEGHAASAVTTGPADLREVPFVEEPPDDVADDTEAEHRDYEENPIGKTHVWDSVYVVDDTTSDHYYSIIISNVNLYRRFAKI
jgi:hypothetical protein